MEHFSLYASSFLLLSPLSLIRFLICFYKLPINRSALWSLHRLWIRKFAPLSFLPPICNRLLTPLTSSSGAEAEMTMKLKLVIILCSLDCRQAAAKKIRKKYKLTLNKVFCLAFYIFFIPHSLSMQKAIRDERE